MDMKKTLNVLWQQKIESERDLVESLLGYLRQEGYKVRIEVPNMGQSADIVAVRGRWVTFIEAKMTDWERALDQCRAHEQVADFICVAVASQKPSEQLLDAAMASGYGVIHCDRATGECTWILRPERNASVWRPERLRLAKHLKAISYAH